MGKNHTLVTFLGRGRFGRDNENPGYEPTTYGFPKSDNFPKGLEEKTSFLGLALTKYIEPDQFVILGTEGSQWSVLVEHLASSTAENQAARDELFEAECDERVTQDMLNEIKELMSQSLGCPVVPIIVKFGKIVSEQYEILGHIAKNVLDGIVSLDLTHSYRHFTMIGFLSAFMLERVRNLKVKDLWYGAYEMTPKEGPKKGITPVIRLDGLERVRHWINALEKFSVTRNYGVFETLLIKDDKSLKESAAHLRNAAFHERTTNLFDAEEEIKKFLQKSGLKRKTLQGASGLFKERLLECLKWVDLEPYSKQQAALAREYLKLRDYVRAAIFGWETLVTQECERQRLNPRPRRIREIQNPLTGTSPSEACEILRQIRNALTHGTAPNLKAVQEMLEDEKKLYGGLEDAFNDLLPNE